MVLSHPIFVDPAFLVSLSKYRVNHFIFSVTLRDREGRNIAGTRFLESQVVRSLQQLNQALDPPHTPTRLSTSLSAQALVHTPVCFFYFERNIQLCFFPFFS